MLSVSYTGQVIDTLNVLFPKGTEFYCLKTNKLFTSSGLFIINKKGKGFAVNRLGLKKYAKIYQHNPGETQSDFYADRKQDIDAEILAAAVEQSTNSPEKKKEIIMAYCRANYRPGVKFKSMIGGETKEVKGSDFRMSGNDVVVTTLSTQQCYVFKDGKYAEIVKNIAVKCDTYDQVTAVLALNADLGITFGSDSDDKKIVKAALSLRLPQYVPLNAFDSFVQAGINEKVGYSIISFNDHNKDGNLDKYLPLISSYERVPIYKGDLYYNAYVEVDGTWHVSKPGKLDKDHICMPGKNLYSAIPFVSKENAIEFCKKANHKSITFETKKTGVSVTVHNDGLVTFDRKVSGITIEVLSDIQDALTKLAVPVPEAKNIKDTSAFAVTMAGENESGKIDLSFVNHMNSFYVNFLGQRFRLDKGDANSVADFIKEKVYASTN